MPRKGTPRKPHRKRRLPFFFPPSFPTWLDLFKNQIRLFKYADEISIHLTTCGIAVAMGLLECLVRRLSGGESVSFGPGWPGIPGTGPVGMILTLTTTGPLCLSWGSGRRRCFPNRAKIRNPYTPDDILVVDGMSDEICITKTWDVGDYLFGRWRRSFGDNRDKAEMMEETDGLGVCVAARGLWVRLALATQNPLFPNRLHHSRFHAMLPGNCGRQCDMHAL